MEEYKDSSAGKIPSDWKIVTIADVANIKGRIGYRGYTKEDIVEKGQGAISASPSNIKNNKLNFEKSTYISWFKYEESPEIQLVKNDILLVKTGSSFGKVAIVDELKEQATINPQLVVIKATSSNPIFLFYIFADNAIQKQITSTIVGGAIPTLSQKNILKFKILLPPLPEQQKIAEILSTVDAKIEVIDQQITETQELKKGLMQQLLTGKLSVVENRFLNDAEMKDSPLGRIPKRWEVVALGKVAKIERGKFQHRPRNDPRFYGGDYPYVQTGDIAKSNGKINSHSQTLNELGLSVSRLFPIGTIVITIAANIGDTAIAQYEIAFPDSLIGINAKEGLNNVFLRYFLVTQKDNLNKLSTVSAQKNINLETLKPYKTPIPPLEEQKKIAEMLGSVDDKIAVLLKKKNHYQELKKGLMQQLLTGKFRVNSLLRKTIKA